MSLVSAVACVVQLNGLVFDRTDLKQSVKDGHCRLSCFPCTAIIQLRFVISLKTCAILDFLFPNEYVSMKKICYRIKQYDHYRATFHPAPPTILKLPFIPAVFLQGAKSILFLWLLFLKFCQLNFVCIFDFALCDLVQEVHTVFRLRIKLKASGQLF